MAQTNPLLEHWLSAYDGQRPLLDVGCAYGRNVRAAAEKLVAVGQEAHAVESPFRNPTKTRKVVGDLRKFFVFFQLCWLKMLT